MLLRSRYSKSLWLSLVCFFLISTFACDSKERYAGTYSAHGEVSLKHSQTVVELKEDGQGLWQVLDEEVSFRWSVKGDEIRLHTEEGGVIIGKIQGDTLNITLPGAGSISFKKSQES